MEEFSQEEIKTIRTGLIHCSNEFTDLKRVHLGKLFKNAEQCIDQLQKENLEAWGEVARLTKVVSRLEGQRLRRIVDATVAEIKKGRNEAG